MIGPQQMLGGRTATLAATLAAAWSLALLLAVAPPAARAEDQSADPPDEAPAGTTPSPGSSAIKTSGLPVPRFVSIRSNEVNAHTGPSTQYPIAWVYTRKGMPVEVVAEFDTWRRIRDREGTESWVLQGMLSAKRAAIVVGKNPILLHEPAPDGRPVARAETGVIALLLHCRDEWCQIDAGGYRGWLKRTDLWGVTPTERLE